MGGWISTLSTPPVSAPVNSLLKVILIKRSCSFSLSRSWKQFRRTTRQQRSIFATRDGRKCNYLYLCVYLFTYLFIYLRTYLFIYLVFTLSFASQLQYISYSFAIHCALFYNNVLTLCFTLLCVHGIPCKHSDTLCKSNVASIFLSATPSFFSCV